ncbi:WD40 repeat domain-containing protein [Mongoliitalea lutea]|nr:WD40 repeat domain-containing protein [Mongoliitalea lutea]
MKRVFVIYLMLCLFNSSLLNAAVTHAWNTHYQNIGVRFNPDKSQFVVFSHDRITKWDMETGKLLASFDTYMSDFKRYPHRNSKLIDVDDYLLELVFSDGDGSIHRFSLLQGQYINFPKFNHGLRIFHGYVDGNKMVYTTTGDYNVSIYDQNTSKDKIVHEKYFGFIQVPVFHKVVIIKDKGEFLFVDGSTYKKKKLGVKNTYSYIHNMPDDWMEAYSGGRDTRETVQFVNLVTGKKEAYKGEEAKKLYYPKSVPQPKTEFIRTIVRSDDKYYYQFYNSGNYEDGKQTYYKYGIRKVEQVTGKIIREVDISSSQDDFLAVLERVKQNEQVAFKEFKINFNQLPLPYSFDYNSASAREIQTIPFVKFGSHPSVGSKEFAIGKIMDCYDGGVIVLTMSFTQGASSQTSHFYIRQYDKYGLLIDSKDLGKTIKQGGGFDQITRFTIEPMNRGYSAVARWEMGKGVQQKNYAGGCND